jgi:hypothetical protein
VTVVPDRDGVELLVPLPHGAKSWMRLLSRGQPLGIRLCRLRRPGAPSRGPVVGAAPAARRGQSRPSVGQDPSLGRRPSRSPPPSSRHQFRQSAPNEVAMTSTGSP